MGGEDNGQGRESALNEKVLPKIRQLPGFLMPSASRTTPGPGQTGGQRGATVPRLRLGEDDRNPTQRLGVQSSEEEFGLGLAEQR